jgi:enediyne biosynthesis protein E4
MNAMGRWVLLAVFGSLGCGQEDLTPAPANPVSSKVTAKAPARQIGRSPLPHQRPRPPAPRSLQADDWFEDVTARTGVQFAYQDGSAAGCYTFLEAFGGGVSLLDYDSDGLLDLFFTGGGSLEPGPPVKVNGRPSALFHNEGNWTFRDVTVEAGFFHDTSLYTHGSTVADFDRDGYPDLVVIGFQGLRLYQNQRDGRFRDVTPGSGLQCHGWGTTAAWADTDRDGWSDLYVVTYAQWTPSIHRPCVNDWSLLDICPPTEYRGERDQLWRNRGDGTFDDITVASGLSAERRGLGIVAADIDADEWIDFYVVNDMDENDLYFGSPDGHFESAALIAGAALSAHGEREGSMGVDLGDYDGDGEPDLFYTNFTNQDSTLLRKVDRRGFINVNTLTGISGTMSRWVGFSTGFADFDSDGWLDLFVINGDVLYRNAESEFFQPAQLFQNIDGKRYIEVSDHGGPYFSTTHCGRGAAVGDLDNDGALDLVIVHQNDPVTLLRNRMPPANWVRVELRGRRSNPDAIGAKVTARIGRRVLTRWVYGGGNYLSHSDRRILFPLADNQPLDIEVHWPSGLTENFSSLASRQNHVLLEGTGKQH